MSQDSYRQPDPALARLVDQPRLPGARVSYDHQWICFLHRPGLDSIRDLAVPELKLAGIRFNPERYAPSAGSLTFESLALHHLPSGKNHPVSGLPPGPIHAPAWSPDSSRLVLLIEQEDGLRLWAVEIATLSARELCPQRVNGVLPGGLYRWCADGRSLLTRLVIEKDPPQPDPVPKGPMVRVTTGEKAPLRTYQDLLRNDNDIALFEHYTTSQLARIDFEGGVHPLGEPAINYTYRSSPNCRYLLRRRLLAPYSFLVPYARFPGCWELLSADGQFERHLTSFPAAEELPKGFDSVLTGPREYDWRDDAEATLIWAEALDGGDMKAEVEFHDRLMTWRAPFQDEPTHYFNLDLRYDSVEWAGDQLALIRGWRYSDRRTRTWAVRPDQPQTEPRLLEDRSFNDHYRDPGRPLYTKSRFGTRICATTPDGQGLYLAGRGATPEGLIPFLDCWDRKNNHKERLWSSKAPYFERVVSLLDTEGRRLLTLRESVDSPPNFYLRDLERDTLTPLTEMPHPTPEFQNIRKEQITYQREDGVQLSGTLYLPADDPGGPRPVVMWAYPLEYKSAEVAGQITTSPYEFNRVSYWGPLPFLINGWAVFDDPKMPIVGHGDGLPNDDFRRQLIASARAAIDALVERGVCDPERVAVGGHSYGAFMVVNLLAHSDLFRTGIARSGAYNRTLTPFGFQGEERDFWEAREVYQEMSPFFYADRVKQPLLLIHGEEDNNPGTYPMQSERLFAALKGLGGQARLVLFPKESHGYKARETMQHMLWEQQEWLKRYL